MQQECPDMLSGEKNRLSNTAYRINMCVCICACVYVYIKQNYTLKALAELSPAGEVKKKNYMCFYFLSFAYLCFKPLLQRTCITFVK